MKLRRGDFALIYFPHSDLRTIKLRPVLVGQADDLNTGLSQIVVAMVTSNMARAGCPSRVSVSLSDPETQQTGLKSKAKRVCSLPGRRQSRAGIWSGLTVYSPRKTLNGSDML